MVHLTLEEQDHLEGSNLKPIFHRGDCNPSWGGDPWEGFNCPLCQSKASVTFQGIVRSRGRRCPPGRRPQHWQSNPAPRWRVSQGWGGAGRDRMWFLSTFLPSEHWSPL